MTNTPKTMHDQEKKKVIDAAKLALENTAAKGIKMLELRPKKMTKDEAFEGDHDFIADPKELPEIIRSFIEASRHHKTNLVVTQKYPAKTRIELAWNIGSPSIVFEIWPHIELLSGRTKLKRMRTIIPWEEVEKIIQPGGVQPRLEPRAAALIYLTHLEFKKKELGSDEVKSRILQMEERILSACADTPLTRETLSLLQEVGTKSPIYETSLKATDIITKKLNIKTKNPLSAGLMDIKKRISMKARWRLKLITPIVGPDGVGKGTVTTRLQENSHRKPQILKFKDLFRKSLIYKIILRPIIKRSADERNIHEERISGILLTIALIRLFQAQAVMHIKRQRKTILMDRFFTDYMAGKIRSTPPETSSQNRWLAKLIPTPDKMVVMFCSHQTRKKRKHELSDTSCDLLELRTIEYITKQRLKSTLFLCTERPIPESTYNMEEFLFAR